jgi:hypothetical protein
MAMRIPPQFRKAIPLGVVLTIVIGLASVKPQDAASNISAWLDLAGIHNAPQWIAGLHGDRHVIIMAAVFAAIYAAIFWGLEPFKNKLADVKGKQKALLLSVPVITACVIGAASWYLWTPRHANATTPTVAAPNHPLPGAPRFKVIVASKQNRQEAKKIADAINSEDPTMKASVVPPLPCNNYFAVTVRDPVPAEDAQKLIDQASELKAVTDKPYPSNGKCAQPSFDCTGDLSSDEQAICNDTHLAELDQKQDKAYRHSSNPSKREINTQLLSAREECGANKLCILDQQLFAIWTFASDSFATPSELGSYRLEIYHDLQKKKEVPPKCKVTTISEISSERITFSDKSFQLLPTDAPPVEESQVGDKVLACIVSSCERWFFDRNVYSVTNFDEEHSWMLRNSEGGCD